MPACLGHRDGVRAGDTRAGHVTVPLWPGLPRIAGLDSQKYFGCCILASEGWRQMLTLCFSVFPGINTFGLLEVVIISIIVQVFSGQSALCPGGTVDRSFALWLLGWLDPGYQTAGIFAASKTVLLLLFPGSADSQEVVRLDTGRCVPSARRFSNVLRCSAGPRVTRTRQDLLVADGALPLQPASRRENLLAQFPTCPQTQPARYSCLYLADTQPCGVVSGINSISRYAFIIWTYTTYFCRGISRWEVGVCYLFHRLVCLTFNWHSI